MKQKLNKNAVLAFIFLLFFCSFCLPTKFSLLNNQNITSDSLVIKNQHTNIFTITDNMFSVENDLTRRQAVINFIAALQLVDGGFVSRLDSPEGEETSNLQGYDAISALVLINGLTAINRKTLIEFIAKRQLDDGGVVGGLDYSHETPNIGIAYGVVYVLAQLDALDAINKTALLNWVLDCYHPEDGRFTLQPKSENPEIYRDDYYLLNTIFGVLTLYWMNELDKINLGKTIEYILSCYQSDGGFSNSPHQQASDYSMTEWAIRALKLLNALDRINKEKTISYVLQFYNTTTQTFMAPGPPLTSAYRGTIILSMLYATDRINTTKIIDLVLSCQSNLHGGFTITPDKNDTKWYKESVQGTKMAVEMLAAVNALDRLNEPFSILYKPEWYGKPYIPRDVTDSASSNHDSKKVDPITIAGNLLVLSIFLIVINIIYNRYKKRKRLKKLKRIKAAKYRRRLSKRYPKR